MDPVLLAAVAAGAYFLWARQKKPPTMREQVAAGLSPGVTYQDLSTPIFKPAQTQVTVQFEPGAVAERVKEQAPTLVIPASGQVATDALREALARQLVNRLETGKGLNTITEVQAGAVVRGGDLVGKKPPAGSNCKECPLGFDYVTSGRESQGVCGGCQPIGFVPPLIRNPNTANGLPPIQNPEWVAAFKAGKVDKSGAPFKK